MNKFIKILLLCIILWGLYFNIAFIFSFDKKYFDEMELTAIVKVVSEKVEKEKSNSYIVKIKNASKKNLKNTKVIVYTSKNFEFRYGDIIEISGKFSKGDIARNYKGFNYRNYLKQSKIYGSVYSKNVNFLKHENGIVEKIYELKCNLNFVMDNIYNKEKASFLKGILLGNTNELDEKIKENFKNSSMSHVLAISGMHVSYVVIGVQFILNKLINGQRFKNNILILILVFFAIITGGSSSCVRACIMNGMLLLSQNFYRKNNFYVSILITFLILIVINPYNIFAVGMWLSFAGTLGIVLFHRFLFRFIVVKYNIKSNVLKSFLEIFLVSFSAQIMIIPIMIYCFNTISLTFFISNLLIYFLIGPILALGYISIIVGLFMPNLR